MKFLRYKKVTLGELDAHQFTVIEIKWLFSIIFYYFRGDGWQDRFHTHAFNAVSFRFFGTYLVREIVDGETIETSRTDRIRYFPKSVDHMLGPSRGCLTLLLSGPWDATWVETKNGRKRTLQWGRKSVERNVDDHAKKSA